MVEIKEVTDEHFEMGQQGPLDDDEYSDTGKQFFYLFVWGFFGGGKSFWVSSGKLEHHDLFHAMRVSLGVESLLRGLGN
jgi:hypothetical protein